MTPHAAELATAGLPALHAGALWLASTPHSNALIHFLFRYGLIGIFLISIVDSSFVPLPIPGITDIMLVFFAAQHASLLLLVLASTLGSAVGGYLSYEVGHAGGMQFLEKHVPPRIFKRVTRWMENHALIAGALKMSKRKFLTTFTLSRAARHAIAAWLGIHYGKQVLRLMDMFTEKWATTFLVVVWTVILVGCGFAFWKIYNTSRTFKRERRARNEAAAA